MSTVLVIGGFDDIRSRDIRPLEEAAKYGPVTVRLLPDAALPSAKFPFTERAYILRNLRFVTTVVVEDTAPVPGTILAVCGAEFDAAAEWAACDAGLIYRVIADSALEGFPAATLKPKDGGQSDCGQRLH